MLAAGKRFEGNVDLGPRTTTVKVKKAVASRVCVVMP